MTGIEDVSGLTELAAATGKSTRECGRKLSLPDAPPPARRFAMGPVWETTTAAEWILTRRKSGPKPR